ncbi:MAG: ParB N-terminal domain-containing protein [Tychonema bourrellyi B0820]|uniref:Chromosome partitioning protein ParB n=1 Tax=Tychonema bourrellyi FEM_GT703 TaxID=2040638 RepID=A0A2G4F3S2_9CYAN|nr:ParB N-terminal domain-containing protein [Tychonema bourrellyi]MDQ2097684.1 ParB N-terminal domain-containing protein [Tychonema bourrellyi B0820]PHX56371.1 chromosome partitioning protein ParB [Tychonema bourrellyi FEM_GT703]
MKKLFPSLVAVKRITSAVPRSNFAEADLERLARLILESGGLINPIIVRRNGMDAYEIVDGDFEYYAAARAKEIEPLKGETIGAFILEEENEKLLLEQLEIHRKTAIIDNPSANKVPQQSSSFEQRLTNIETRLENRINELKAEYTREKQALIERVKDVESRIPKPVPLLEALNTQDKFKLATNLKNAGIKAQIIEQIIKQRDLEPFASFENVLERMKGKGLGDKTMIKLIDKWQKNI